MSKNKIKEQCKNSKFLIRYWLGNGYPEIYFTQREAECVVLLLEGCSSEKSGKVLHLSSRTIEFYLKNVKQKLNCVTKNEVILKTRKSDFMEKIMEVKEIMKNRSTRNF